MDKVYVVWYDNGEPYEDNFVNIEDIFKTEEDAKQFVKKQGYTKKEPYDFNLDVKPYQIVDNVLYFNPDNDNSLWDRYSSLEIREYPLRSDNTVYNEKKESEYKPSEADTE